jgi:predicted negative regulator of RcsB-dependent stress response
MNKNTKMLLALGVIAVAGYFYWKSTQTKKSQFSGPVGNVEK